MKSIKNYAKDVKTFIDDHAYVAASATAVVLCSVTAVVSSIIATNRERDNSKINYIDLTIGDDGTVTGYVQHKNGRIGRFNASTFEVSTDTDQ